MCKLPSSAIILCFYPPSFCMRFALLLVPSLYASRVSEDVPGEPQSPDDGSVIPPVARPRRVVFVVPITPEPSRGTEQISTRGTTQSPATTSETTGLPRETTSLPSSISPAPIETWTLSLGPKFVLGAAQRRGYRAFAGPEGSVAACPKNRDYCIDTRYSDAATCMYPSPETIKECLDDTCAAHPGNEAIFKSKNEDSYCKDWQKSPEGRVCHWTSDVFCSCPKFSIVYTNAEFVAPGEAAPQGYALAQPCKYADNYKAKNKRGDQENNNAGPNGQPLQRLQPGHAIADDITKAGQTISTVIAAAVASCILVVLF